MVTGASTADLAVILIDARKGVLTQTRRHSYLAHLIGIRHIVLAVNKMDLVGYDQATFDAIVADYRRLRRRASASPASPPIPISGFKGDNITDRSREHALVRRPDADRASRDRRGRRRRPIRRKPFRMPVQWVNRPNLDFRGFAGPDRERHACSRATRCASCPRARPRRSRGSSRSTAICDEAVAGQSVTLTLADEVDCSRGDVIAAADDPPQVADQFEATIVWMADEPMLPGRAYWLKLGTQTVDGDGAGARNIRSTSTRWSIWRPRRWSSTHRRRRTSRPTGRSCSSPMPTAATLGGFILIDKLTNATVAAGMLHFALRRAQNVHWQAIDITPRARMPR